MKPRVLLALLGPLLLLAVGCNQTTGTHRANLIGTHDLVLVDQPQADGHLAVLTSVDGGLVARGMPSRFLYVTSADTNELRVLENFREGLARRDFLLAPNPLETLSIPVLDRPTLLAVDEGRNREGTRITGAYVYASRPGAAEVSVVSVARRRQLGGKPMATPAPVTAIGAFMQLDLTAEIQATPLPATTRLFVATWDGDSAAVYAASIPTDSPELAELEFQRVVLIGQTPIIALQVVAPLASRTMDGVPFCDTGACLAIATRASSGVSGDAFLIDPQTGRLALLSFSGPVRDFAIAGRGGRIYGVLDEQACGGPQCGGVVAVDLLSATTSAAPPYQTSFPPSLDALGIPMRPLRAEGLITGLTVASGGTILQPFEGSEAKQQFYSELGAFSSSSGVITFFSGLGGSIIDWHPFRTVVSAASVRLPGLLPDGGYSLVGEDGGVIGSSTTATVTDLTADLAQTWRVAEVSTPDQLPWIVDISDGYLDSQNIVFVYQGQIPGLVSLPTSEAEGLRLSTGGLEVRAQVGDIVRFETGSDTAGYRECGRTRIATLGAGFVEVAEAPAGCEARVRFSVRADGAQPLVVAADIEGYMGRWAPGETLTYNRPYVLLPAEVTATRTALTVNIPATVPALEEAFTRFEISGRMTPYRVSLDLQSIQACYTQLVGQVVLGNLVMDRVPSFDPDSTDVDFRWTIHAVVPSGNSVVELNLTLARVGALATPAAFCSR